MALNNSNNTFSNQNSFFSAPIRGLLSHNTRSLTSSTPQTQATSISRTFLRGKENPAPLHSVDLLLLQEVGEIWCPEALFTPEMTLAAFSVDQDNSHSSLATFYCGKNLLLLDSEILQQGRVLFHSFSKKNEGTKIFVFNVYGIPGNTLADRQELAEMFRLIINKLHRIREREPTAKIFVGGDYNCNSLAENSPKAKMLQDFLMETQLFDLTENLPPQKFLLSVLSPLSYVICL